jgi:CO/xanthine dehydrogenase FAD-binding subunit
VARNPNAKFIAGGTNLLGPDEARDREAPHTSST